MDQAISNAENYKQKPGDKDIHHDHQGREFFSAPFPRKLHQILEDAENLGFTSTIGWMDDGESFLIVDKDRLENEIMPRYFLSGKFKSFQRSLNLWGFTCERTEGVLLPGIGSRRHHPLFLRGKIHLCKKMRRTRIKKPGTRSRDKNNDRTSVHKNGSATQATEKTACSKETMSNINASLPLFPSQLAVQSPYTEQALPCTFQVLPTLYRFGSSGMRPDLQSFAHQTLAIVAQIILPSSPCLSRIQEDMLLRYLVARRERKMRGNEATQTECQCNSLQP